MTISFHATETARSSPFSSSFFLTGATASGKTALGVEVASSLNAEIISLDSMALYRRMDVGTAKPTLEERRGVRHHMIDVAEPSEEFSAVEYMSQAAEAVRSIRASKKIPLFVGGTPLYLKTILFGVFDAPPADLAFRDELTRIEEREGKGALWTRLRKCDPRAAERLHPNDLKRVIRALEVYHTTGKTISEQQTQFSAPPLVDPRRVFILTWTRETLYERINRRVDLMMDSGFFEETRALFSSNPAPSRTAAQAVGYRELNAVALGEITLEEAVEKIKQYTRNFAKRQETWFRSLTSQGARRVDADGRSTEELRDRLVAEINKIENESRL